MVPQTPLDNGLRVQFEIDTGAGYVRTLDSLRNATGSVRITDGQVVYVPHNAIKMKVFIKPISNGDIDVYDLRLFDTATK